MEINLDNNNVRCQNINDTNGLKFRRCFFNNGLRGIFHNCNVTSLGERTGSLNLPKFDIFTLICFRCMCVGGACAMMCWWSSEDKIMELVLGPGGWTCIVSLRRSSLAGWASCQPTSWILEMPSIPGKLSWGWGNTQETWQRTVKAWEPSVSFLLSSVCTSYSSQTPLWARTSTARSGNSAIVSVPFLATVLKIRCQTAVAKNGQWKKSMFSLL